MQAQALAAIERLELQASSLPTGLCLFDPDWHQGVIGILAARIKERLHRPVIAFARSRRRRDQGFGALHTRSAHSRCAGCRGRTPPGAAQQVRRSCHGGGPVAGRTGFRGLCSRPSMPKCRGILVPMTSTACCLYRRVARWHGPVAGDGTTLRDAGPWGQGFPEPLFDGEFAILEQRVVGERHLKLVLQPGNDSHAYRRDRLQ